MQLHASYPIIDLALNSLSAELPTPLSGALPPSDRRRIMEDPGMLSWLLLIGALFSSSKALIVL